MRRMLALAGFVTVVALVVLLLYRVYIHHIEAGPYVDDDRATVRIHVKIANAFA